MASRSKKLEIVIAAKVNGFLSGITRVKSSLNGLTRSTAGIGRTLSNIAGGGGVGAIAMSTINAAGSLEMMKLRLEAVTGTAKKAEKVFAETFKLFKETPLMLEPLLQARILLEGIGVRGQKALEAVAKPAVALEKNIVEVAQAVAALETEPLRRMGIEMRRAGEAWTLQFQTPFGKVIKLANQGTEKLRKAVLFAFDVRFGNILSRASKTYRGLSSTLKGLLFMLKSTFGMVFLPDVRAFQTKMKDIMTTMEVHAETLGSAIRLGFVSGGIGLFAGIKKAWDEAANPVGFVFNILGVIKDVMIDLSVELVRALLAIGKPFGELISFWVIAELKKFLRTLPGLKNVDALQDKLVPHATVPNYFVPSTGPDPEKTIEQVRKNLDALSTGKYAKMLQGFYGDATRGSTKTTTVFFDYAKGVRQDAGKGAAGATASIANMLLNEFVRKGGLVQLDKTGNIRYGTPLSQTHLPPGRIVHGQTSTEGGIERGRFSLTLPGELKDQADVFKMLKRMKIMDAFGEWDFGKVEGMFRTKEQAGLIEKLMEGIPGPQASNDLENAASDLTAAASMMKNALGSVVHP